MNKMLLLIFILLLFSNIHAETELSSFGNRFPFKYYPTSGLELTVIKKDNTIEVIYPNGRTQEITTIKSIHWNDSENITKDLNFDGYIDLGIWAGVNPRGLNESYDIFIWDNKKLMLKEVRSIVNPSIELHLITENAFVPYTMCPDNKALCVYKTRYRWENDQLLTHSTLTPQKDDQTKVSFYKGEKVKFTVTVPYDQVDIETNKWNAMKQKM